MFDGQALRTTRKEQGIGSADLAFRAGVSRQSIWMYESGAATPRVGVALALCRILGVPLESLFVHEPDTPTPGDVCVRDDQKHVEPAAPPGRVSATGSR